MSNLVPMRQLNSDGIKTAAKILENMRCQKTLLRDVVAEFIADLQYLEEDALPVEIDLDCKFASKQEFIDYFNRIVPPGFIDEHRKDVGLWTWLAFAYAPQLATGHFYPLTAIDKNENVVGHFIIRFPDPEDLSIVRFGFVIVAPEIRGKGFGQEMLRLGIQYAKNELKAKRVCLGVFENNESARKCYEAVGFTKCSEEKYKIANAIWNCIEMELF